MLVLPQEVTINWNNATKKYYMDKGYIFTDNNDEFNVNVLDLKDKSSIKVDFICDYCKKQYKKYYLDRAKNGDFDCCYDCRGVKSSPKRTKYNFDIVKEKFKDSRLSLLESNYLGYGVHHKYICLKCENEHTITFKNLLKGKGCPKCSLIRVSDANRFGIEEVENIFKEEGCLLLSNHYDNSSQKLNYICSCGEKDSKSLTHFKRGQRCDKCASIKRREKHLKYDIEICKELFKENDCVLLEDEYLFCDKPMKYICSCGNESKITLMNFLRGARCKVCSIEKRSGEFHWKYNHELTLEERKLGRNIIGYNAWRTLTYERDNYTCQCCGDDTGGNLNAHHLDGYDRCKEKRVDVDNGITLCENCHIKDADSFHKLYGFGGNTLIQFKQWYRFKTGTEFKIKMEVVV